MNDNILHLISHPSHNYYYAIIQNTNKNTNKTSKNTFRFLESSIVITKEV